MKLKLIFQSLLISFFGLFVSAQQVVVFNENTEELFREEYVNITITYDTDSVVKIDLVDGTFYIDSNLCNEFVDIKIDPTFGQIYHNQFLRKQLQFLDTIVINQTTLIARQTPRLLIGCGEEELDSIFQNKLWFKDWLKVNSEMIKGIYFWVYNTDPMRSADKKRAKKVIQEYCSLIDQEEFAKKVEFKKMPYVTDQDDSIYEGTVITRKFIQEQNTEEMTRIAEKYSLTIALIIDWGYE